MTSMQEGQSVPEFALEDLDGKTLEPVTKAKLNGGIAVLAFFKSSCPVCQMTAPYLDRLKRLNPELPLYGISQDDQDETRNFRDEYDLSFPILMDRDLETTRTFELTNVPSIFVIRGEKATVERNIIGFEKAGLEYIHAQGGPEIEKTPLFSEADQVPEFRPG